MVLNAPTDSETPNTPPTTLNGSAPEDANDGGFPIEGDGGTVDSSSQAHIPPPPPA